MKMNTVWIVIPVGALLLVAMIVGGVVWARRRRSHAAAVLDEQRQQTKKLAEEVKAAIGEINLAALTQVTEQLTLMTGQKVEAAGAAADKTLEQRQSLIDAELKAVSSSIEKAKQAVIELSTRSSQQFGNIGSQLAATATSTAELSKATNSLREMLSSSRARGQHGEFLAEGVLGAAGLVQDIHYYKHPITETGTIPDYSAKVGADKTVSIDCKFPLDNLWRSFEAESEAEEKAFEAAFFRDVQNRINEVTTRDYIGPDTIDLVILFVSSEGVYSFIFERDPNIFEYAMRRRVVLAGPFTLFALLSVIRQGNANFIIEKQSQEILALMRNFNLQWTKFVESFETLGKKLEAAGRAYDALASTRRNQLERSLNKIEALSDQTETVLPPAAEDEGSGTADKNAA